MTTTTRPRPPLNASHEGATVTDLRDLGVAHDNGIEVRAGVHTGEVEVRPDHVVGLTVSIAKPICDLAGLAEVFVSQAVKLHLVGSGIASSERAVHVLKGVPDEWRLFAVEG